jgi:hypothetical protein
MMRKVTMMVLKEIKKRRCILPWQLIENEHFRLGDQRSVKMIQLTSGKKDFEVIFNEVVRYRRAVVNGVVQKIIINELGHVYDYTTGWERAINKPSGNDKYYSINYVKNEDALIWKPGPKIKKKYAKVSLHRCVMETFMGLPTEDHNWKKLRPESFTEKQWMGLTKSQREFISKSGIHVDHINGDKYDNSLSNLQYMWASDNVAKGGVARR